VTLGAGPLVLLLHGVPDNARSWRHQLPALSQAGYRAVAMQVRGCQPTSRPADGDYSLQTPATDVSAFLDSLEADSAHLVGHDWRAAIAYTAAAQFPQRLRSLTALAVPHAGRFLNDRSTTVGQAQPGMAEKGYNPGPEDILCPPPRTDNIGR
jgi:pimeloyl-ACP methyl ester carboxylesterase